MVVESPVQSAFVFSIETSEGDEDWQDCNLDIIFDDLWFASRGDGGGTLVARWMEKYRTLYHLSSH